jgi:hypothetical protein
MSSYIVSVLLCLPASGLAIPKEDSAFCKVHWITVEDRQVRERGLVLFSVPEARLRRLPIRDLPFKSLQPLFQKTAVRYQPLWSERLRQGESLADWMKRFDGVYRRAGGLVKRTLSENQNSGVIEVTRFPVLPIDSFPVAPADGFRPMPEEGSEPHQVFAAVREGVVFWARWDVRKYPRLEPLAPSGRVGGTAITVYPSRLQQLQEFRNLVTRRVNTSLQQRDSEDSREFDLRKGWILLRAALWDRFTQAKAIRLNVEGLQSEKSPISLAIQFIGAKGKFEKFDEPVAGASEILGTSAKGPLPKEVNNLIWALLRSAGADIDENVVPVKTASGRLVGEEFTASFAFNSPACHPAVLELLDGLGLRSTIRSQEVRGESSATRSRSEPDRGEVRLWADLFEIKRLSSGLVRGWLTAAEHAWYQTCLEIMAIKHSVPSDVQVEELLRRIENRAWMSDQEYYQQTMEVGQIRGALAFDPKKDSLLRYLSRQKSDLSLRLQAGTDGSLHINAVIGRDVWRLLSGHWRELDRRFLEKMLAGQVLSKEGVDATQRDMEKEHEQMKKKLAEILEAAKKRRQGGSL